MRNDVVRLEGGIELAYSHRPGAGRRLVLIHGWRCRRADWGPVADALAGFDVTAIDLPGHGDSPDAHLPPEVRAYGRVLADALAALGLSDVVLIGHSMGGAVACEAAILSPERVDRIVAVDSLTYDFVYPRQDPASIEAALVGMRADWRGGVHGLVDALFPVKDAALIDRIATEMADADPGPAIDLLAGLLAWDMDARVPLVRCPIDILASASLLTPGHRAAAPAAATLHPVDLGGHFFLREQPAGTARAIREVLGG